MKKIKSNPLKTILTISMGFLIIYFLTSYKWSLITSLSIGLIGLISKFTSILIEKIWFKIAEILSYIIPNILLTIIFYIFLFPLSILSRLFQKSDNLKLKKTTNSNFVSQQKKFDKSSFINPW